MSSNDPFSAENLVATLKPTKFETAGILACGFLKLAAKVAGLCSAAYCTYLSKFGTPADAKFWGYTALACGVVYVVSHIAKCMLANRATKILNNG